MEHSHPYDDEHGWQEAQSGSFGTFANSNERLAAALMHGGGFAAYLFPLGNVLVPLLLWVVKRDESELLDRQGKEVLNFQLTATCFYVIGILTALLIIGIPVLIAVVVVHFVLTLVGTIRTAKGEAYRYPFGFEFIK